MKRATVGILIATALTFAACIEDRTGPVPPGLHLEVFEGGHQRVGTDEVSGPMSVRVLDRDDHPVPGIEVTWHVTGGHGTVTPAADTTGVIGTSSATYRTTLETGVDTVVARLGATDSIPFRLEVSAPSPPHGPPGRPSR